MPLFRYRISVGSTTKIIELRKSNPQGWLSAVVREAFPEVSARRAHDIMRLRLLRIDQREAWYARLTDDPDDMLIEVEKLSS
jgi:hypothetical protein